MPLYDLTCSNHHEQIDLLLKIGERPPCPLCGLPTETLWKTSSNVIGDDIPGGIVIRHLDLEPVKYYSKSAIDKHARERGFQRSDRHITNPKSGSDKHPFTKRWF